MHCPGCGKQVFSDQQFCRFCGRSLGAVTEVLAKPPAVLNSSASMTKVTSRMAARRMNRSLLWGLIVIVLGVTLLSNAQGYALVNWLGILTFLAGIGLAVYGACAPGTAKELLSSQIAQPETLKQSQASSYLPPQDFSESVPSVTERTTELLEIENTKPTR
jgi:hypothetical protein